MPIFVVFYEAKKGNMINFCHSWQEKEANDVVWWLPNKYAQQRLEFASQYFERIVNLLFGRFVGNI